MYFGALMLNSAEHLSLKLRFFFHIYNIVLHTWLRSSHQKRRNASVNGIERCYVTLTASCYLIYKRLKSRIDPNALKEA